jgi:hypothetical protein
MTSSQHVYEVRPCNDWRGVDLIGDRLPLTSSQDVYEVRPRKDRRGVDLIGDRLPLGLLWFEGPDAIEDAVSYARSFSHPHTATIRVLDESGMLAVTLELADDFSRAIHISARPPRSCLNSSKSNWSRQNLCRNAQQSAQWCQRLRSVPSFLLAAR